MKLSFPIFEELFDKALKANRAFILDWKASIEDIVFNIKSVYPSLKINSLPEKQVYGDWVQSVFIEDKEYSFKTNSETLIPEMISTINKHLLKFGQTLIFFDTQDDNYYFILIKNSEIPEYLDKGFVEV
jgi:phage-related protein